MIIHYLHHGQTPHPMPGNVPAEWPEGHVWAGEHNLESVNCPDCLEAIASKDIAIYEIQIGGNGFEWFIKCLRCGKRSYNHNDIKNRYCSHCHAFLDDIWPPAKKAWLASGNVKDL